MLRGENPNPRFKSQGFFETSAISRLASGTGGLATCKITCHLENHEIAKRFGKSLSDLNARNRLAIENYKSLDIA